MNALEAYTQLADYNKGQHLPVTWQRHVKTYRECPHVIAKRVTVYVRAGIDYANLKQVKEAISAGIRGPVDPITYGNWRTGFFPFIIDHERKDGSYNEYLRLYPAVFP